MSYGIYTKCNAIANSSLLEINALEGSEIIAVLKAIKLSPPMHTRRYAVDSRYFAPIVTLVNPGPEQPGNFTACIPI